MGEVRNIRLYRTDRCRNCGRLLTSEESIDRGFGPGCGLEFAERFITNHPRYLGERAKKVWTEEEVQKLIDFALSGRKP